MESGNKLKGLIVLVVIVLAIAVGGGVVWWLDGQPSAANSTLNTPFTSAPPVGPTEGPLAPNEPACQALPVKDAALVGQPYAPGWPMVLPGEIVGTPVVADLLGDGKLEIIVPCVLRNRKTKHVHPSPNEMPLLFALRPDGTGLPGWPVAMGTDQPPANMVGGWSSSPSVFRRDGKDEVVIMGGHGGAGVKVVNANRLVRRIGAGDSSVNVPLVDLDGDGVMDVAIGTTLVAVDGKPVNNWPAKQKFRNGYSPCIGDAFDNGHIELFHLYYTTPKTNYADLMGVDNHGERLRGWPKKVDDPSWFPPVMGDTTGDSKMEIIGAYGKHLFAWNADGSMTKTTSREGMLVGILKSGISAATSSPALADLDGDGKAEIILFDSDARTIRAWHGDGTPLFGPPPDRKKPPSIATRPATAPTTVPVSSPTTTPAAAPTAPPPDGIIATLPADAHGVSVVSLGDDPKIMDFFAGTYWVRLFPGGKTEIKNMVPGESSVEWTQPTVCDIDADGKADVIFGLSDGRLFIYNTGLAYHADRMQWPTANGNFQHTGAWKRPGGPTTAPATMPTATP